MMRRCAVLGLFVFVLLGGTDAPHAQVAPRASGPFTPYPYNPYPSPANICSTQWGWCHLPAPTQYHKAACGCLTAQNQVVQGFTQFFPTEGPLSPYLQPHTTGVPSR